MKVYSHAEVLFGFHTIVNWDWSVFIKSVLEGLFNLIIVDDLVDDSHILGQGIDAYQALFHAGGIMGTCTNLASSYVNDYFNQQISESIAKKLGSSAKKIASWGINLIIVLTGAALNAFSIPNPKDVTIYNVVNNKNDYLTIIAGFDGEITMEDIINQVNNN